MSQNSSKIKLETERRCQNERCGADISHLHGNAKHCDNLCWMIHQAIDEDKKRTQKNEMYKERAKKLLENNHNFIDHIKQELEAWIPQQVSFRFLLECVRYRWNGYYRFTNSIQKYIKAEFSKQYPEMMRYIK